MLSNKQTFVGTVEETPSLVAICRSLSPTLFGMTFEAASFRVAYHSVLGLDLDVILEAVAPPNGNSSEPMMKNATDTPSGPFSAKIFRENLSSDHLKANIARSMIVNERPSVVWASAFWNLVILANQKSVLVESKCGRKFFRTTECDLYLVEILSCLGIWQLKCCRKQNTKQNKMSI